MKKTKKTDKPIWAKNIVARQKAAGIASIEKLAEDAKLPYPTVRDIANGISEGGFEKRSKIAKALGCTVADLYREDVRDVGQPIQDLQFAGELISRFAGLSPTLQKIALTVIYQDTSFLKQIPPKVAEEMALEIGQLFQPIQKVARK